jgi:hypothetical protein
MKRLNIIQLTYLHHIGIAHFILLNWLIDSGIEYSILVTPIRIFHGNETT